MEGYLGEFPVNIIESEFNDYTPSDWAIFFIDYYGQFDGGHHKQWTLDQVARILKGTPVVVVEAKWDNGESNYRVSTGKPSQEYLVWVEEMGGENYDFGIAP